MTYRQFKDKWLGKGIDYDKSYGFQCVDVYRMYCKEVLDIPQSSPVRGAKDIWNTYLTKHFTKIPNTPEGVPNQGDVVIWGHGEYGHVGIVDEANKQYLTCFEQNWVEINGTGVTELRRHTYANVTGWLRPDIIEAGNTQDIEDIRVRLLDDAGIKDEGTTREVIGAWKDKPNLEKTITELNEKYEKFATIHESVKEDFTIELQEAEKKVKSYKDFITEVARIIGTTQETEPIKARAETLVKKETILKAMQENRPLTRHPFEGIGDRIRTLLDYLIKKVK